jgi:hypothetical protein
MKEAEENVKSLEVKRKEKEMELGSKEEEVKKLQTQLYQIKTNKEYTAMLNEIESRKADNSVLEEDIIKLMDAIDSARSKVKEEKEKFEQESKNTDEKIKQVDQRVKEIDSALAEFRKKRDEITPSIDPDVLKDYNRILAGRGGLAIVRVVNDTCGGCYMHLPPQVINEIRMKDKVIYCESCQRILYITDEA